MVSLKNIGTEFSKGSTVLIKAISKETGGTGLGLSIIKHSARYHNAKISLYSVVGKGTTITVSSLIIGYFHILPALQITGIISVYQ